MHNDETEGGRIMLLDHFIPRSGNKRTRDIHESRWLHERILWSLWNKAALFPELCLMKGWIAQSWSKAAKAIMTRWVQTRIFGEGVPQTDNQEPRIKHCDALLLPLASCDRLAQCCFFYHSRRDTRWIFGLITSSLSLPTLHAITSLLKEIDNYLEQ